MDGTRIAPERFEPTVLRQGDALELPFRAGALSATSRVRLWLDGYDVFE